MSLDRRRPGAIAAHQEATLRRYVREDVLPNSPWHRDRFAAAGIDGRRLRRADDLAALPPVMLDGLDPAATVLRPTVESVRASAAWSQRLGVRWASLSGSLDRFFHEQVDPAFRVVVWTTDGGWRNGWSAADLAELTELGRRALGTLGLTTADSVVSLLDPATTGFWQLAHGCRLGGVPSAQVTHRLPPDELVELGPTVLAGRAADVGATLQAATKQGADLSSIRLVLAVGERLTDTARARLTGLAPPGVVVRNLWAPPGVRALWPECAAAGAVHTWPDTELLQIGDDGALVWSSLVWRGTAVLRLDTGLRAEVDPSPCPCGLTTPRLRVVDPPARRRAVRSRAGTAADDGG